MDTSRLKSADASPHNRLLPSIIPMNPAKHLATITTKHNLRKGMVRIVDLEQQIQQEVERLIKLKSDIREAINQMENVDEKLLLRYRYIGIKTSLEVVKYVFMLLLVN